MSAISSRSLGEARNSSVKNSDSFAQFNISGLYRPSLNQSKVKGKNRLKKLKKRFLKDLHPHIKESLQTKKMNFKLKKNFSLDDGNLLEEFYAKRQNKGQIFSMSGFMTNIEGEDYMIDKFEKELQKKKVEKLTIDQNAYLKITEKTDLAKTLVYVDKFPLLSFRKIILFYWERFRRICFKLAKHSKFEFISLLVIIMNSAFILLDDPTTVTSSLSDRTENLFLILYTIEMMIKLIGFGLYAKKTAFFRDFWNILDFIIVGSSLLNIILSDASINLSALRSLRVLRPLKTISTIKKLKNLIITIFSSIPFLIDILMVLLFVYTVFAIAGLHLFQGVLKRRCWDSINQQLLIPETTCSDDSICPDNYLCLSNFENPNYGITNFDNIGYSLLMVFQITTLEGWYFILEQLMKSFSEILQALTILYFIFLIFIGNFLILNLVLAVIIVKFNETQRLKLEQMANIVHNRFCLCSTGLNFSSMKLRGYFVEMSNMSHFANQNCSKKYRYVEKSKYHELKSQLVFDKTFDFLIANEITTEQINMQLSRNTLKNSIIKTGAVALKNKKNSWAIVLEKSKTRTSKYKDSQLGANDIALYNQAFKSKVARLIFQSRVVKNIRNSIKDLDTNNLEALQKSNLRPSFFNLNSPSQSNLLKVSEPAYSINDSSSFKRQTKSNINLMDSEYDLDFQANTLNVSHSKKSRFAPRINRFTQQNPLHTSKRSSLSQIKQLDEENIRSETSDAEIFPDDNFKKEILYTEKAVKTVEVAPSKTKTKMRLSMHKRKRSLSKGGSHNFGRGSHIAARPSFKEAKMFAKPSKTTKLQSNVLLTKSPKKSESVKQIDILIKKNTEHLQVSLNLCQNFSNLEYLKQRPDVLPSQVKAAQLDEQMLFQVRELQTQLKMFYDIKLIMRSFAIMRNKLNSQSDLRTQETNLSHSSVKQYQRHDKKIHYSNSKKYKNNNMASSFTTLVTLESHNTNRSYVTTPLYIGVKQSLSAYYYTQINQQLITSYDKKKSFKNQISNMAIKNEYSNQQLMGKDCKHKTKNFYQISKFFFDDFEDSQRKALENDDAEFNQSYLNLFYDAIIQRDIKIKSINIYNNSITDVIDQMKIPFEKINNIYSCLNINITHIWLRGFNGNLTMLRHKIQKFYELKAVDHFFIMLVLVNTVVLCLTGLIPPESEYIESLLMSIITYIFTIEAATKILGYGVKNYCKDFFNVFDFLIVCISIAEMFIESDGSVLSAIKVVRVLRTFRVLRVTRLLRSLKFMRIIIEVVVLSLEQFVYIALLLLLFIIIFSMLGMQLFAGKFDFYRPGEIKRQNFDSFSDAFLSVFQIMTIENWNDILVLSYRCDQNFLFSILYLISWIFIGNYILLNLFMAILLDGFSSYSVLHKYKDIDDELTVIDKILTTSRKTQIKQKVDFEKKLKPKTITEQELRRDSIKSFGDLKNSSEIKLSSKSKKKIKFDKLNSVDVKEDHLHHINQENETLSSSDDELENIIYKEKVYEKLIKKKTENIICENSLILIPKNSWFRQKIIRIVTNPFFETIILIIIMLSSVKLIIDTYEDDSWKGTLFAKFLSVCDTLFNIIFLLEFLFKIISYGFVFCKGSYLRDSWNIIDFFIVCTSLLDMVLEQLDMPFLKILRILRTLRPLRFLSTNQNMRIVVSSLIESIGGILNVLVVILIVWIMFGILGINLMADKLGYCNYPDTRNYYEVSIDICKATGGVWAVWGWNFDNIFNALVTLFILTSGEGWPNIMFTAMDANSSSAGPVRYGNYYIFGYFLAFMLVGSLFLMNLFVGVIFMQFTTEQDNEKKKHFRMITDEQFKWVIMQKMIEKAKPDYNFKTKPKDKFRLLIFKIINSNYTESFILIMIIINIATLAIIYDGMSDEFSAILEKINLVFTIVFILEAVLKLVAFGFKQYFATSWNQFDFVIVVSSIIDIVLTNFVDIRSIRVYPQLARVLKILRVTRLFKLMKSQRMQSLNRIIKTLTFAIPALLNVLLLLCLIYFLFTIMGVFIFQNDSADFANFGAALIMLFRLSTGEDWPTVMFQNSVTNQIIGRLFFLSFIFFSTFIMINMFVLIVIEQFENFYFNPNNPISCFDDIADEFRKTWILFSYRYQAQKIKSNDLYNFFVCLPVPLGFHIPLKNETEEVYFENFNLNYFLNNLRFDPKFIWRKITDMNIYEDNTGHISFGQVLHAAMRNAFGYKCLANASKETKKKIRKIELQAVAKIFKETEVKISTKNKTSIRKRGKTANPFANILFAQLTFQIWANFTKKHNSSDTFSNEELDEVLYKNPEYHFHQKVASQIRKPSYLDLD